MPKLIFLSWQNPHIPFGQKIAEQNSLVTLRQCLPNIAGIRILKLGDKKVPQSQAELNKYAQSGSPTHIYVYNWVNTRQLDVKL